MILNQPRPCANGCGARVEWAFDRQRRVGLIECESREAHACPKRLRGAFVECACGARIHTYADGSVEDARSQLPHACTTPTQTPGTRAGASLGAAPATAPLRSPASTSPSASEQPRRSLNDALGVG